MLSILLDTVANARFGPGPAALFIAAFFFVGGTAYAQSTVVIGGNGKSSVEVNLDVLNPSSSTVNGAQGRRILRMPGEAMAGSGGVIKLRMPAGMKRAAVSPATTPTVRQLPKFKLKPPAMPAAKPRRAATPAKQMAAKPAPTAPRTITKPAPVAPRPVVKALTPPPPPPPPVVKKMVVAAPAPVAKAAPAPVAKPTPAPVAETIPAVPVAPVKQVASLPRTNLPVDGGLVSRISFTGSSTRLSNEAKQQLQDLAAQIATRDDRLQLKAYAGGTSDSSSSSRRLSLSRALAVRSYLIEAGVRSTRIDVRALGRAADAGPPDRVDMILLAR